MTHFSFSLDEKETKNQVKNNRSAVFDRQPPPKHTNLDRIFGIKPDCARLMKIASKKWH
jgi:hypothetical protein